MKIFVSGPMTEIENYNIPEFNRVARMLRNKGWEVINPVDICNKYTIDKVLNDKNVFEKMINEELELLKTCDAIYMMKGWEDSIGANREYILARKYYLKFIFEQNGIIRRLIRSLRDWCYER